MYFESTVRCAHSVALLVSFVCVGRHHKTEAGQRPKSHLGAKGEGPTAEDGQGQGKVSRGDDGHTADRAITATHTLS